MTLSKPHFIFGEETFTVEQHVNALVASFSPQERDYFEGQFDLSALVQAGSSSGLFATQKIILVKNPWFFSKAPSDDELDQIRSFLSLAQDAGHTVVVYQFGTVDQRKKVTGLLKKSCEVIQCLPFKDWEQDKVLQWIIERGRKTGKTVTRDAALALEEIGGTNLRQLAGELDKCAIYVGDRDTITPEDIKALCASASASIFDFNEAMKRRNVSRTLQALTRLFSHGEDPIKLLGLITANIRLYYQLLSYTQAGHSMPDIAKFLGKNPYFLQKMLPDVKRAYTLPRLKEAYAKLADCDINIKSGKMKPEVAVELLVASL